MKLNREEFIRVAIQVSTWEKGTIPFRAAFDQLIAEFDRLNEIIKNQSSLINNMGKRGATLQAQLAKILEKQLDEAQSENEELKVENKEFADVIVQNMAGRRPDFSGLIEADKLREENEKLSTKVATLQAQLDRISEPYHYSRDKAEYPWIRHEGKADGCPICNHPPSEKYHYAEAYPKSGLSMLHKGDKEDCLICNPHGHVHTPDEGIAGNPPKDWVSTKDFPPAKPKCEHKNLEPLALGGTQRCPECHGTKYINRVVSCADWEQHPCYMIADCHNCSGAKG